MLRCAICLDEASSALRCPNDHSICASCFTPFVDDVCRKAAAVELPMLTAAERQRYGRVACPCTCDHVFSDAAIAKSLSLTDTGLFERYMHMRTALAVADQTAKAFEEAQQALQAELVKLRDSSPEASAGSAKAGNILLANQIQKMMPNARQCKMCGWGPMAFRDCSDLASHHGQVVRRLDVDADDPRLSDGKAFVEIKIDNSCPRCGWFAKERKSWPKWDGVIHDDALPNHWEAEKLGARQWYPKVAAAEKREQEALAKAVEAEAKASAAEEARREAEEARREAERGYLEARGLIAETERACLSVSVRVQAQLERERSLRLDLERAYHAQQRAAPALRVESKAATHVEVRPIRSSSPDSVLPPLGVGRHAKPASRATDPIKLPKLRGAGAVQEPWVAGLCS